MAPLQGVVSMDGSAVSSAAIQVCHFAILVCALHRDNLFLTEICYFHSHHLIFLLNLG